MTFHILEAAVSGYDAGMPLVDVTLKEARAMECNRCGDCCNGMREGVKKDESTGLPLFVWGKQFPVDLYEKRYGQRMLVPIVLGDGGPEFGAAFELDADGKPYTAFGCSFLEKNPAGSSCETTCALYNGNPRDPATVRPRACGEFPVYGQSVDHTIIDGHPFVPPVGALPRCTWYGIRIVGPWKEEPKWQDRWARQMRGESVRSFAMSPQAMKRLISRLLKRRPDEESTDGEAEGTAEESIHD